MTDDDRCPWSDLPKSMCEHCQPAGRPHTFKLIHNAALPSEHVPVTIAARPALVYPTGRTLPEDRKDWRLHDYVAALCDFTRNAEPRDIVQHHPNGSITTYTERHITVSPPLLVQLHDAIEISQAIEGGRRQFTSKPSGRLEAIDLAARIEHQVHQMLRRDHGLANSYDDYPETIAAVRHLGSVTVDRTDNARTIRSWWAGARVVTGWDLPAFKPNNTCPLCGVKGSLRIKYPTALCVSCVDGRGSGVWDEDNIGLLAEHIRAENNEPDDVGDTPGAAEAV